MNKIIIIFLASTFVWTAFIGATLAAAPPQITGVPATVPVDENKILVAKSISVTDGDPPLTFSMSGGQDKALFSIDATTGMITFNAKPDYEVPRDNGKNNQYDIVVKVTDSHSAPRSDTQAISIVISNVVEIFGAKVPASQTVVKDTLTEIAGSLKVEQGESKLDKVVLSVTNGTLHVISSGNTKVKAEGRGSKLTISGNQDEVNRTLATLSYQGNRSFSGKDFLKVTTTNMTPLKDTKVVGIEVLKVLVQACDWSKSGKENFAGDLGRNWSAGLVFPYSFVRYNLADKKSSINAKALGFGMSFRRYDTDDLAFFGNQGLKRPYSTKKTGFWEEFKDEFRYASAIYSPGDAETTSISEIPVGCRAKTTDILNAGDKISAWFSISPTFYVFQEKEDDDVGVQLALNLGFLNDILSIGVGYNLSGNDAGEWFIMAGPSLGIQF